MSAKQRTDPVSVRRVFNRWSVEASYLTHDIGAYRSRLQWGRAESEPWPKSIPALKRDTAFVCDWIRKHHRLEQDCFQRVAQAAEIWLTDRRAERLPDQAVLQLELWISRAALDLASFPLLAAVASSSERSRILSAYVQYAIRVRDWSWDLIRAWPAESEERWRFNNVVLPRCVPDTGKTPLALALQESRQAGELAVFAPMLKALDAGIQEYLTQFIEQPKGNVMISEPSALNNALNDLIPYIAAAAPLETGRAVRQPEQLVCEMSDDATLAGVTFEQSLERARADADQIADGARNASHPEMEALYRLASAALPLGFAIAKATRFDDAMTPGQLVYGWGRLGTYLDRLAPILRSAGALWPTTPGTTLAQFSGDSALAVAIQFSGAVRTAVAWALGYSSTHGKYPPNVANRVVSGPHTDPAMAEWLSRTVDELRKKTLPPEEKWAGWEMNRDSVRLQSLIDDEYRRACDAADRRLELEPDTAASTESSAVPANRDVKSELSRLWNALSDRKRYCLQALGELKAFDAASRRRAEDLAKKAEGRNAKTDGFKEPLSKLVKRDLLESKTGRGGGYWLSAKGRELLDFAQSET